ncbi:anti-sigma factor family protein [Intrasporangium flavum]|uniref:anti-sigma factor family protein n=1 Tax=Intrasporangium flavum TaxID=1428657 RepID=UPI00096F0661|nr:hypothetical protein [Intrasporangium flavum]
MTPHLRGYVRAYVDRALPPAMLHLYDKHLVCCLSCRDTVERERRIVAALRSDTGVPTSLRSALLGLAATGPTAEPDRDHGPRIPLPPMGLRGALPSYDPVPTVHPGAPALHRSPMRAAVVASIAAGASVAAAWGLAVSPVPGGTRLPTSRVPVASFGTGPSSLSGGMTALTVSRSTSGGSGSASGPDASLTSRLGPVTVPYWVVTSRVVNRAPQVGLVRYSGTGSAESTP